MGQGNQTVSIISGATIVYLPFNPSSLFYLPPTAAQSASNSRHSPLLSQSKTLIPLLGVLAMPIKRLALRLPKAFKPHTPSPRSPGSTSARDEVDPVVCLIDDLVSPENRPENNGVDANAGSDLRSGSTEGNEGGGDPGIGVLRRSPRTLDGFSEHRPVVVEVEISGDLEQPPESKKAKISSGSKKSGPKGVFFVGDPVPDEEARRRWPHHYEQKVLSS